MAVIDIRINAQNDASRELLQLRANMNALNRTLADQRVALSNATGAERDNIQQKINSTRAAQTQNRLQQQTLTLQKQFIAQGAREARQQEALERQQAKLSQSIENTSRNYGGWLDRLANSAYIYSIVGHQLTSLVRSTVQVGAETERYQAVLRATETNSEGVYRQLQLLNRELIGTDFATINRTFLSLRAAGLGLDESITTVRGLSRALGQLQVDAYDQQRFFTQLTQSYAQNRLELDEFKILQETLPNILRLSSRALNTEITSYQQLKDLLDESNRSARDYYQTLASFAEQNITGIDPTTYTAQLEQFRESVREVQRDISRTLIPILARGAGEARSFIEVFGSASRGNIVAFVASIVGVTGAVRALTAVYGQWQFASQLVNLTTITSGANAARLTVTLQGLSLGLRTMTTNLAANLAAWNAAGVSMGAALGIITLTTTAIGYFAVRAEVARNRVDDFTAAMGRLGEQFQNAEGSQVRFSELTERQLRQSVNTAITERERLEAEINRIRQSAGVGADTGIEELQAQLQRLSQFRTPEGGIRQFQDREQAEELSSALETLVVQYGIINRTIATYENRLKEIRDASAAATQAQAEQAKTVGQLQVELARADRRLVQTGSALRRALANQDVEAIRQATAAEVSELEKRAAIRQMLLAAEAKSREQNEENALKNRAESIQAETRLESERARVRERSETRIQTIQRNAERRTVRGLDEELKVQVSANEDVIKSYEAAAASGQKYADALRSISAIDARRAAFDYTQQLIAQGQSFEEATRQATAFFAQVSEIPTAASAQGQFGREFTSGLREDFENTAQRGNYLLSIMAQVRQISNQAFRLDLEDRIPDPGVREQEIDDRIAAEARGQQTLTDIRQSALEQGRAYLEQYREREEQAIERSLQANTRQYRQFARIATNLVDDVAISRTRGVREALTAFLQASVKRILQNAIETQLLLSNERRIQNALRQTAALRATQSNTSILGSAVAGLAGGNPIVAALATVLPQALNVSLQIGENQSQQITNLSNSANQRRSPR